MSDSDQNDARSTSSRLWFPDDEAQLPWLSLLLEAYAIIDVGVAASVRAHEDEFNVRLACKEGCDNCCRAQSDIPLYPLELAGITWFVTEKMTGPQRATLKGQLMNHAAGAPCPFLISGSCGIHRLRPVACRQFNVFNESCEPEEDPFFTRRDDVLTPIRDYTVRAFSVMAPFYGFHGDAGKSAAVSEIIETMVLNLQSFDWKTLVEVMEGFDSGNG